MPLLISISTVREYDRFRSNWVGFSLTGAIGRGPARCQAFCYFGLGASLEWPAKLNWWYGGSPVWP
jgi:hypothetical protein